MREKRCIGCGKVKPLSEFYAHPRAKDGYLNKCKECTRADVKAHREAHPEKDLETRLKACAKNPTHKNANRAVEAALRSGRLEKPNHCQGCGRSADETRIGAHHYDYTRPLDVIWLCAACHRPVDKVRAFVESGRSFDEWKHEKNIHESKIRRALRFYRESGKERKPSE